MNQILSNEEIQRLILSLAKSRGKRGFTEEEATLLCAEIASMRIGGELVNLALYGKADVDWNGSEAVFSAAKQSEVAA